MCDASAATLMGPGQILVANDEDNVLRLYNLDSGGTPVYQYDVSKFLRLEKKKGEVDIEGAARIRDRVFWIGSHGRNKEGKERLDRSRFFATDITVSGKTTRLSPVGRPYQHLLEDMFSDPRFDKFQLQEAARLQPKEEDALNIEGLGARPDGAVLIGFRNPIPRGKALIIPLLNPNLVLAGAKARFGNPITLDLGGLGIRDLVLQDQRHFILAGPHGSGGPFRLYTWSGSAGDVPKIVSTAHFRDYNPEALVLRPVPGATECVFLSDDGALLKLGKPCKDLEPALRSFRAFTFRSAEE